MKRYDIFDVTRYVLAIMVVAIHTQLFPSILYPWLRLAVPLFFILSSYLLFERINDSDEKQKSDRIKKYIKRNLLLYLFWFITLLPITIYVRRGWAANGIMDITFIRKLITNTLFNSTFIASWFIVASLWAVVILWMTRDLNRKLLLLILSIVYAACVVRSAYFFLIDENGIYGKLSYYYEMVFTSPVFSFPIATFYMFIGKLFAEHKNMHAKKRWTVPGIIVFSIALWLEWKTVVDLGGVLSSDCFFFIAPLSVCLFAFIKDIEISVNHAKQLRTISIVMYPLHASLVPVVNFSLSNLFGIQSAPICFFVVIFLCHVVAFAIQKLEYRKHLGFLRFSH